MKKRFNICALISLLALPLLAMVNPSLQPFHLVDRYNAVVVGEVTKADDDQLVFRVTEVFKGSFAPLEVTLQIPKQEEDAGEGDDEGSPSAALEVGDPVVAFVGGARRRTEKNVLIYARSYFHQGEIADAADPSKWGWQENLGDEMWGTFNGDPHMLVALLRDATDNRVFFPAVPFEKFKQDLVIDRFPTAVRGVALYDVNGDGLLDIYACHESGNQLYLQTGPMKFEKRTKEVGLEGVSSMSCNFADVNADNRSDLLVGEMLYLGNDDGVFKKSDLLPEITGGKIKASAFAEVNGDGYPDVIVSITDGGLLLFLNPGKEGVRFADASESAGLRSELAGSGGSGFFATGEWNGDGRADIFYSVNEGILLVQSAQGKFEPVEHSLDLRFTGETGAGTFAPIWGQASYDLVIPTAETIAIAVQRKDRIANVTSYGNELNETHADQLAALCEDFNADGRIDIYMLTSSPSTPLRFMTNRGYGSFMNPENYSKEGFPGESHTKGAWGGAAGDVNADGATDILLGGMDGTLSLAINDTLSQRVPEENPGLQNKVLLQTKLLSARVSGKLGVLGSDVRIETETGQIIARQMIGANTITGCRSPDVVNFAVRERGNYTLKIRFSDGYEQSWPVNLSGEERRVEVAAARKE